MLLNLSLGKFYGIDSLVEFLIIIVSAIISIYSYRIYKIIKNDHYKFFSWAFLAIAVSFIFKILSNLTITHRVQVINPNFVITIIHELESMEQINFFSFIFYKIFYLIGFLILFLLITKTKNKEKIFLFAYLSIIAILFSIYFNFVFHVTLIFILLFLTINFRDNYKAKKSTNSFIVFMAFLLILVSHFFLMLSNIHSLFYLTGEIVLLIGFLNLLLNQIKIKNEQKTNKARSDKRYIRSFAKK